MDIQIPFGNKFNSKNYFVSRKGLNIYLMDGVVRKLFSRIKPVENASAVTMRFLDLKQDMYDKEIKEGRLRVSDSLWEVAALIDAQKDGQTGPLLTNGVSNVFYAASGFGVELVWNASRGEWKMLLLQSNCHRFPGSRVFFVVG